MTTEFTRSLPVSDGTEPWMRGTHTEFDPVRRAVIHALELTEEDARRWAGKLTDAQMFARPLGIASVAFHLRHIVRSLDRMLTYAEGGELSLGQLSSLLNEEATGKTRDVLEEFYSGIARAKVRVAAFDPASYGQDRALGRKKLPTTVGGLLIHLADHTQRHAGQVVTTSKVARAMESEPNAAR